MTPGRIMGAFCTSQFGFGRVVQHKQWPELLAAHSFQAGKIWPLILLTPPKARQPPSATTGACPDLRDACSGSAVRHLAACGRILGQPVTPSQPMTSRSFPHGRWPWPLALAMSGRPGALLAWRGLLALLVCGVTWLALTPAPPPVAGLLWDKANHLAAFASLAVAASCGFPRRWKAVALGLLVYGVVIELLQSVTPTRVGEAADLLADACGIALGLAMARLATAYWGGTHAARSQHPGAPR